VKRIASAAFVVLVALALAPSAPASTGSTEPTTRACFNGGHKCSADGDCCGALRCVNNRCRR
jgi:hypothetical protein